VREREEGSVRELGFAARARAPGADGDGALLLAIDGDRDGDLVLFDHDTHLERTDGSCEACHHMSLPLDRHSGCSACHRDMHEPTELFDHTLHQDVLGGNDGCSSCHVDAAVVKSRETSTACGECHGDDVGRSPVIQDPDEAWRPPVGYQEAMHGLCVTCHELAVEDAPGLRPPTLATCTTCHDADRAERLEGLRPSPPAADGRRSAGGRPSGRAAGGGE
jgi:hypothetical protein